MKLNTTEVRSFMLGNLLGDGNLHNGAFITGQINEDLILFKKKIFDDYFGFSNSKITFVPANEKNGIKRKDTWRLYISPNQYFKKLEAECYQPKKIVTKKMLDDLTLIGLAIWFADDGTTIQVGHNKNTGSARSRRVQICTDSFSLEEVTLIKDFFENKYGKTVIINRAQNSYRVQINNMDAQKFLIDISPYFINYFPSLLYKLDMGYRNFSLDTRRYVTEGYKNLFLKISSHPAFIDRMKIKLDDIV